MTVYDIDREMQNLIDPETGEVLDYDAFVNLQLSRDKKIENAVCKIKNYNALISDINDEIETLKARKEQAQRNADKLADFVARITDYGDFTSARCDVRWRKSERVEITDAEAVPKKYLAKKVTYSPDKAAIREALKGGKLVRGCTLAENMNIQIDKVRKKK